MARAKKEGRKAVVTSLRWLGVCASITQASTPGGNNDCKVKEETKKMKEEKIESGGGMKNKRRRGRKKMSADRRRRTGPACGNTVEPLFQEPPVLYPSFL